MGKESSASAANGYWCVSLPYRPVGLSITGRSIGALSITTLDIHSPLSSLYHVASGFCATMSSACPARAWPSTEHIVEGQLRRFAFL